MGYILHEGLDFVNYSAPQSLFLIQKTRFEGAERAMKGERARLDRVLVMRGLAETREKAKAMIEAGLVSVDGRVASKPGLSVPIEAKIEVRGRLPYVSRGGLKLEAALDAFGIQPAGMVVADIGASTGGFTDCLLQRGARRVYAIDVGHGQLASVLRQDERVIVMEGVNIRYIESLPELVDLATIDVSFISLRLVLPAVLRLVKPAGLIVALIKPQFEAGREQVGKGGVVRKPAIHRHVLQSILQFARQHCLRLMGLILSPVREPAGNIEFLAGWTRVPPEAEMDSEETLMAAVDSAIAAVPNLRY